MVRVVRMGRVVASGPGLAETVSVGLVPTLLPDSSWTEGRLPMSVEAAEHSWVEIERAFRQFHAASDPPQVVVIPEVSVPEGRLAALRRLAAGLGCLVIAGLDFQMTNDGVVNRAAVLVPTRWPEVGSSHTARTIFVGKTYPADEELRHVSSMTPPAVFSSDPTLWVFDAGHLGRFGVCLCFDFMDVDRPPLYRAQIHHLFVLAHNKDIGSFGHIAESLCRTIYCNVVVCNTGWYGGSVALAPFFDHARRPVFQMLGSELSCAQVIRLPVAAMDAAIRRGVLAQDGRRIFKARPPGFRV